MIEINLLLDLGLERELVGSLVLTCYDRRMPIVDYREQERPAEPVSDQQSGGP